MTIPPNLTFVRLQHLKNNKGRLYLNDLDPKIPAWVGVTPCNDAALLSYTCGSVQQFIDSNIPGTCTFTSLGAALPFSS